jgi:DNA helicase-2/ATP-dependent DNA helicase PcrA
VRQKIRGRAYNSMMDQWEQVLTSAERAQVRSFDLDLSYRSTWEIIEYSKSLLQRDSAIHAVDRHGAPVETLEFETPTELTDQIVAKAEEMLASPEVEHAAVLCHTIAEATLLYQLLKDRIDCSLVSREDDATDTPLVIMPVYFAKGLEFDGVVAVEANQYNDGGELSYILCTRALHRLVHIRAKA